MNGPTRSQRLAARHYPELAAGGFSRVDGAVGFYSRVHALLPEDACLVDFGAGRGKFLEDPSPYRRKMKNVSILASRSIAVDVDPGVLENQSFDERYVVQERQALPIAPESADVVVSDWTLEHVANPTWFASEVCRILKPGGWFCARTPNKWGVVGIPTRMTPFSLHVRALRRLAPDRKEIDTFPTTYRMNTRRKLHELFPEPTFNHYSYIADSEPGYVGGSRIGWRAMDVISRFSPENLRSTIYIYIRKNNVVGTPSPDGFASSGVPR